MLKEQLRLYAENNFNVLLIGPHGVGKTEVIKELMQEQGLKMQYFSASTMDPWVDFIGVPKEKTDEKGVSYLDLVRPKAFADDEVEVIFLDELSRAHKKVVNAVFELIQFKSINGRKFNNLKLVWAAINPFDDDHTYDVERLDPALLDRFHVHIEVPNKLNREYFSAKYSKANIAMEWWESLPEEQKKLVSPRRLDYAMQVYERDGDLSHVLHASTNINKLKTMLGENLSYRSMLKDIIAKRDEKSAAKFINNENNYDSCIEEILAGTSANLFAPFLNQEKFNTLLNTNHAKRLVTLAENDKRVKDKINKASKDAELKTLIDGIVTSEGIMLDDPTAEQIQEALPKTAPKYKELTFRNFSKGSFVKILERSQSNLPYERLGMITEVARLGVPQELGFEGVKLLKDAVLNVLMLSSPNAFNNSNLANLSSVVNFILKGYKHETKLDSVSLLSGELQQLFKLLKRKSLTEIIDA